MLCWRTSGSLATFLCTLPLACGSEPSEPSELGAPALGSLLMPLSTVVNGVAYRLSEAEFAVEGPERHVLSSSSVSGDVLSQALRTGEYSIELRDGWQLERELAAGFQEVDAILTSSNPTAFSITNGASTRVAYSFETDGTAVELGLGILNLVITVTDTSVVADRVIEGDVIVSDQADADALRGVHTITGTLTIEGSVRDLAPLSGLTSVGGLLSIRETSLLTSLEGLNQLVRLTDEDSDGFVEISGNEALTNIDALQNLTGGDFFQLTIENNRRLVNIDGLGNLGGAASFVDIVGNDELVNVDGLGGFTENGGLSIEDNPALVDLSGLSQLTFIGSELVLRNNDKLVSVSGLERLEDIATLRIEGNDSLATLRALGALRRVEGEEFSVIGNTSLPTCEVDWLIDNITNVLGGSIGFFNGDVFFPAEIVVTGNDDAATCEATGEPPVFDPAACDFGDLTGCESTTCAAACRANAGSFCLETCTAIIDCVSEAHELGICELTEEDPLCAARNAGSQNVCTTEVERGGGAIPQPELPSFVARQLVHCLCSTPRP